MYLVADAWSASQGILMCVCLAVSYSYCLKCSKQEAKLYLACNYKLVAGFGYQDVDCCAGGNIQD